MWCADWLMPVVEIHGAQHCPLGICGGISFPFTPGSLKIACPERAPGRDRREQSLPLTFGFFPLLGYKYEGVKFEKGNCGVSIMRSGRQILVVE